MKRLKKLALTLLAVVGGAIVLLYAYLFFTA